MLPARSVWKPRAALSSLRDSVPLSLASDAALKDRSSTSLFRFNTKHVRRDLDEYFGKEPKIGAPTLTAGGDSADAFFRSHAVALPSLRDSVPLSLASDAALKGRSSTSLFRFTHTLTTGGDSADAFCSKPRCGSAVPTGLGSSFSPL